MRGARMREFKLRLLLSSLLLTYLLSVFISVDAVSVIDLEGDVVCSCGCYKLLKNCDCYTAEQMRDKIAEMVQRGLDRGKIISSLQDIYGKEVLATPPKEGLFTGLWMYPIVVLSMGSIVVYLVLRRRNSEWYGDPDENINEFEDIAEM
jgi:cytochrome c-type biogenesis protein CcmH